MKATKIRKSKWVVYLDDINRTKKGVYERNVTIDGKEAFIHPAGDGRTADILPVDCVFEDKAEAYKYFTGEGLLRWVVINHGRKQVPEMFQARVKWGHTYRYGRHNAPCVFIKRADTGEMLTETYGPQIVKTKREAESHFRQYWKRTYKEASKEHAAYRKLLIDLEKCRPRSGKATSS